LQQKIFFSLTLLSSRLATLTPMRRRPTEELLDTDAGTPTEVADSLADLEFFNRRFGGISTTRALIESIAARTHATRLSLLDVATGSGYVPSRVQQEITSRDLTLDVTLLDRAITHVRNGSAGHRVAADVFALPFADNTFDLVSSCLFVHHLAPEQVPTFVTEALRVSRHAVIINDLIRDPLHLALVYTGMPLYRSRITRNDAPASVRQAYTVKEMSDLLKATPAARFEIHRYFLFRMGVIAWKH
jgi:ubiquinone/menaquinone biosynthesis C-methylase UbiE